MRLGGRERIFYLRDRDVLDRVRRWDMRGKAPTRARGSVGRVRRFAAS